VGLKCLKQLFSFSPYLACISPTLIKPVKVFQFISFLFLCCTKAAQIMSVEILTKADLHQFKTDFFAELKELLSSSTPAPPKKWLKSYEVREMLGISRGTLQNMRTNGTLQATPVGGLMFYDYDDIAKLMQGKKQQRK
jgi:Helix-turn-helix domain